MLRTSRWLVQIGVIALFWVFTVATGLDSYVTENRRVTVSIALLAVDTTTKEILHKVVYSFLDSMTNVFQLCMVI